MSDHVKAKFIWYDSTGKGRNLFGLFRKTLDLKGNPQSALLCIFADTSYQLFINGKFIEFGPVRFDPRFPLYDTHDIARHLAPGRNVLAVQVNYFGHKTYKSMPAQAGLTAWGEVKTDAGEVFSLNTGGPLWRGKASEAHGRYASKISFALNAADLFDQAGEEEGWKEAGFDDSGWPPAEELANQSAWGKLAPRSIPFMSGADIPVSKVASVRPLMKNEEWFSFSLPVPHFFEDNRKDYSNFIAYSTWIYSPAAQTVTVGVFWGENWLNGRELPRGVECLHKSMRLNQRWELKAGWNYFFGKVILYFDVLHHYIALPRGKGLILSAEMKFDSPYFIRYSPVISVSDYDRHLKHKTLPYAPDEQLSGIGGWIYASRDNPAQSPCRETSWDDYGEPFEILSPKSINGHVFAHSAYPDGFTVLLDLEQMRLAFPQLKMKGVRGAVIDLTYSEHLKADHEHLRHTHDYSAGDRILCSRDTIEWLPSGPRGMRYLRLTVRNTGEDITLESLSLRSANYPAEKKGSFQCSDALLNEIWRMGARTQATNMEDAYIDCPGRERGMYGRDTIIQYHVNLAVFGDQALMRRCLELYGQSPDPTGKFRAVYPNTGDYTIADFALNMLEGYRAYYENTGDLALIEKDWPAMMGNLQWFHDLADERDDLLLDSEWHKKRGVHSHYGGFHGDIGILKGHMDNSGIHCVFSCTYLIALQSAMILAQALGKTSDREALQKRVDILKCTIPEKFWDTSRNCYSDNLAWTSHSVHASLFAVRAGVADERQLPWIKKHVAYELRSLFANGYDPSGGVLASPNFGFYILEGLYKAGLTETAQNMIKQGWGWALAQGLKTTPEYFSLRSSLCHAWSASPTYFLSKHVLGVHFPKAPDLDEVEIRVQAHGVSFAEGAFPHPKGAVEVKWHTDDEGRRIFDHVKTPDGVKVKVVG
ncbi:MAG: family 78 glycoside hydrolase catalytic domain [Bacillota bacterium]